jgi:hypothetical protein
MVEIISWSEKYYDVHPHAKQFAEQLRTNKTEVIKQIVDNLKKGIQSAENKP